MGSAHACCFDAAYDLPSYYSPTCDNGCREWPAIGCRSSRYLLDVWHGPRSTPCAYDPMAVSTHECSGAGVKEGALGYGPASPSGDSTSSNPLWRLPCLQSTHRTQLGSYAIRWGFMPFTSSGPCSSLSYSCRTTLLAHLQGAYSVCSAFCRWRITHPRLSVGIGLAQTSTRVGQLPLLMSYPRFNGPYGPTTSLLGSLIVLTLLL